MPQADAERLHALPLRLEDGRALVAFCERPNAEARAELETRLGLPIEPRVAAEGDLRRVRGTAYARIPAPRAELVASGPLAESK